MAMPEPTMKDHTTDELIRSAERLIQFLKLSGPDVFTVRECSWLNWRIRSFVGDKTIKQAKYKIEAENRNGNRITQSERN